MTNKLGASNVGSTSHLVNGCARIGDLGGRGVVRWQQPLFIALAILGIATMVAGCGVGLYYYGIWQGGGAVLSQTSSLALGMLVGGGVLTTSSVVGLFIIRQKRSKLDSTLLNQLDTSLFDRTWSYVAQQDGKYSLVVKHSARRQVEVRRQDILPNEIENVDQAVRQELKGYSRVHVCPTVQLLSTPASPPTVPLPTVPLPTVPPSSTHDLGVVYSKVSAAKLEELNGLLNAEEWTYVRQEEGRYSLVVKHPPEKRGGEGRMEEQLSGMPFEDLFDVHKKTKPTQYKYHPTSPDKPDSLLIEMEQLREALQPFTYTFVLQVDGTYSLVAQYPPSTSAPQDTVTEIVRANIAYGQLKKVKTEFLHGKSRSYQFIETSPVSKV